MAIQFTTVPEIDFSRGIDARSTENQISEGFVRDLLNADVIQKSIRKRTGYQTYAGSIPVRAIRLEQAQFSADGIVPTRGYYVTLDPSISLDNAYSSPLIVQGRSSNLTYGTFTNTGTAVKYYNKFAVSYRKRFNSATLDQTTGFTVPGVEHGLATSNFFCNVFNSTTASNFSYVKFGTSDIRPIIFSKTYDVNIKYTVPPIGNVYNNFVYYLKPEAVTGKSYTKLWQHPGTGEVTLSIPPGEHDLTTNNILCRVYELTLDSSGNEISRQQVISGTTVLSFGGSGVTIEYTIASATTKTFAIILAAAPLENIREGTISTGSTHTITLSNVESPWMFTELYLQQALPYSYKYTLIRPNQTYNDITKELSLTFSVAAPITYKLFYQQGTISSNILEIRDSSIIGPTYSADPAPQITVWGLDHAVIYAEKEAREGWTTHLDTYQRSGEQRVIAGLGGNLFTPREYSEAASEYLYPTLYPYLKAKSEGVVQKVGRLIYDTGDTPGRSRGYITSDSGGTGWASVVAVEYDASNSWTKYTLSLPNMALKNSAGGTAPNTSTMISTSDRKEDWLTVNNMSYKRHEGTFRIRDVDDTIPNRLIISVENPQNNSSDWDDPDVGGYAGIFTDEVQWSTGGSSVDNNVFMPGDQLSILGTDFAQVYSSHYDANRSMCGPFDSIVTLQQNTPVSGKRTSSIITLRNQDTASTTIYSTSIENLVPGDMLSYTGIDRQLQILSINPNSSLPVNITADGTTATAQLTPEYLALSFRFHSLAPGRKILLQGAGSHSGVQTIDTLLTDAGTSAGNITGFTFKTTSSEDVTAAIVIGKTIEVDEELPWEDPPYDANRFVVARRWIPIEAPIDAYNLTPSTHIRYFDTAPYSNQPFIRSTMVADTLYLTNGSDEVMKFDGQNIYRAGLPAWQPGLFATVDTVTTGGKIVVPAPRSTSYTGLTLANKARGEIQVTAENMYAFPVGTLVLVDGDPKYYTVRGYEDKGSGSGDHILLLDRAIASTVTASGIVKEVVGSYKYYFRLNAVDANDNIIASAITSSEDFEVQMTENAAIHLKLIGIPALDNYDYSRLEIEIYRTHLLLPTVAPVFYKVVTLGGTSTPPVNFNNTTGYLEYIDSAADTDLTELDKTSVLSGAELGIGWSEPLRAKFITSADNRLVLANVADYPELDIQIDGAANLASSIFAGDSLLFRKDANDSGLVTNMINRVKVEWKNAFSGTANGFTTNASTFSFVTSASTGAQPGDWIYLTYDTVVTTGRDLKYSGWWQIKTAVPRVLPLTGDTITVNLAGASAATSYPNRYVIATDPTNVPVYLGTDGNLGQVNGDSSGSSMETFDATRRMALALNSVMRMTDVSLSGMEDFRPWIITRSGNDVSRAGKIVVRFPHRLGATPAVVPTFNGYALYVNSIAALSGQSVEAAEYVYPSRVLVSYPNYPEIFDSPTAILDQDSLSAIDVNPADGQEITGIVPFFGEAAFTAAQQAGVLVVFKTNSIYLVDINQKVSGGSLVVQRLETQGLGCTAPYSIAPTKNGILFANNSGMYCLRRNQAIEYLGKFMERNWTERVEKQALSIAHGHHYAVGRMYKLSVPIVDTVDETTGYIEPSQVYVYNHTQEEEGQMGAWSRYDSHTAIGWANLASDAFWASTGGRVYLIRTTGTESDFRDANQPITFRLDTRPNSYGNSGIRKILDKVVASYRAGSATASNKLYFSVDLEQEYSETTPFNIAGTKENLTNFNDLVQKDVITLRHSLDRRKGVYFSIRIENSNLDQNVEIAGLDYRVGGLDSRGIKSASKT
jgi:hypothetical protein